MTTKSVRNGTPRPARAEGSANPLLRSFLAVTDLVGVCLIGAGQDLIRAGYALQRYAHFRATSEQLEPDPGESEPL